MKLFVAKFKEREIERRSDHEYTHAYLIQNPDGTIYKAGFSHSEERAGMNAADALPKFISTQSKRRCASAHLSLASDAGLSLGEWYERQYEETKARREAMTIEVVAVTSLTAFKRDAA